jgi:hypothetical protein
MEQLNMETGSYRGLLTHWFMINSAGVHFANSCFWGLEPPVPKFDTLFIGIEPDKATRQLVDGLASIRYLKRLEVAPKKVECTVGEQSHWPLAQQQILRVFQDCKDAKSINLTDKGISSPLIVGDNRFLAIH